MKGFKFLLNRLHPSVIAARHKWASWTFQHSVWNRQRLNIMGVS
ncbi:MULTISPECIES: hypothetical protein [Aeribacillus]|nr:MULTISPECIES: hypothetical protein [Aeribacillus]MED1438951.1 hypothetical protein [Aeribacillus composti]